MIKNEEYKCVIECKNFIEKLEKNIRNIKENFKDFVLDGVSVYDENVVIEYCDEFEEISLVDEDTEEFEDIDDDKIIFILNDNTILLYDTIDNDYYKSGDLYTNFKGFRDLNKDDFEKFNIYKL